MLMKLLKFLLPALPALVCGCEYVDHSGEEVPETVKISVDSVARLLSALPIGTEQVGEVHDAVSSSSANGYDEEYTMKDLFTAPGAGVGDGATRTGSSYRTPLRDLIRDHLASSLPVTKAEGEVEEYVRLLEDSGLQIYWPYSEEWDGKTLPVITFDPSNGAEVNVGYRLREDGSPGIEEVVVDEEMAMDTPVWVVNRNDDSDYTPVEMLRRQDPEWDGGGSVIVKPSSYTGDVRTLVLKDITMRRNFDPWFAGASEFFVKCGRVEDFTASTEAELKLYSPQVSDFMIVVRRNQLNKKIPFNVVLVSQWTELMESIAFMIVEDDGGTRTEWKCSAVVKYNSKSYGFEVSLPFNTRDDIVWRGQLAASFFQSEDTVTGRFGDVLISFALE